MAAATIEGSSQTIAQGPVASQEAIKQLGTNGGGFFGVNSAHPFENPTPLSNAEVHILFPKHYDMDLSPREEWDEKEGEMAAIFGEFLKRVAAPRAA